MSRSILRTLAVVAALAGLAAYATIMLRGPQGISALEEKHRQIRALEEQNATILRNIEARKHRIESLTNDPGAQATAVEKEQRKLRRDQTRFDTPGQRITPASGGSKEPQP
jgi:predicted RNase H-like nuclease (RuvC/YqgF family)